jgi:hypothetical protein
MPEDPVANDYQKYFEDLYFKIVVDHLADFFENRMKTKKLSPEQTQEELDRAIVMAMHKMSLR